MSEYKLTDEQERAVYTKDKNIIVSAQAGAGKTDILVERIILNLRGLEATDPNNLEDSVEFTGIRTDIEDVLVVTFTNKAAQEMKDRIKKKLAKKIEEENIPDKRFLIDQLNKVTNAQISTMHSFCINTVRSYFQKLDINPQFKILNQATLKVLSWQAMDQAFLEFYEKEDEDFFAFLFEYSGLKDDENVKAMLMNLYNFIMSQIEPFEWLESAKNKYYIDEINIEDSDFKVKKYEEYLGLIKDEMESISHEAIRRIASIKNFCEKRELPVFVYDIIAEDEAIVNSAKKYIDNQDFSTLSDFLEGMSFVRMKSIPKKEKDLYDETIFEEYKNKRNEVKDTVNKLKELLNFDLEKTIEAELKQYKFLATIEKILIRFDEIFMAMKKSKDGIDFSDAEHLMVELLKDESVVSELKEKYKYIFFDEYQDANQIQNFIVEQIKGRANLFFVGDIKQSIYKFRLADPSIFNQRYKAYKSGEDEYNQAVELSKNFRSRPEILDFTNFIFDELMTEELGEIKYDNPAHRLNAGNPSAKLDPLIENLTPIEINYIKNDDVDYDEDAEISHNEFIKLEQESNQPYLIAKKIREILSRKTDQTSPHGKQKFQEKDFAVLLRNKHMIPEICDYLDLFDIPYYTDSKDISYSDLEVSEFISILKAIDNDKKDLVLLSALVSVLGRMNETEIAIIRDSEDDKSFYNSFYSYELKEHTDDKILAKIQAYKSKLEKYRNIEKTMSLYDFCWYVLIDSGFMTYLLSNFNGKQKLDNVIAFIEEIKDYEQASQPGLFNFLNHVDRLMQKSSGDLEPGAELSEEDNVVRIMTIHKSKGLQIGNVILANTERRFNKRDLYDQIIYHNDKKIALKTFNPYEDKYESNLFFDDISRTKELELLSEEIRLQYVALTRAKNQLIILGEVKEDFFEKLSDNYKKMTSPIEWISSILLKDSISNAFKSSNGINVETSTNRLTNSKLKFDFNLYQKEDLMRDKMNFLGLSDFDDAATTNEKSQATTDFDFDFLTFSYDNPSQTNTPIKKTVSQISLQNDNRDTEFKNYDNIINDKIDDPDFDTPEFMMTVKESTAKDRGTATHFALQVLPIQQYDKPMLEAYLQELVQNYKISEEEKKLIDQNAIINFYKSQLGQRVINAKKKYKEEAFTMKYLDQGEEILIDGQIDLYFEEDGELVIIDFKTGFMREDPTYKKQLDLYQIGLSQATGKKIKEKYIYWTAYNKFVRY